MSQQLNKYFMDILLVCSPNLTNAKRKPSNHVEQPIEAYNKNNKKNNDERKSYWSVKNRSIDGF